MTGHVGPTVLGGPSDADLVRAAQEGAADAVQETFLLALARLGQVRDPEAVGGWLHAVMRSVCAMELRRPARRVTVAELGGDVPAAHDAVEQLALRDWVRAALEDLPEPLRLVTLLRSLGYFHARPEPGPA